MRSTSQFSLQSKQISESITMFVVMLPDICVHCSRKVRTKINRKKQINSISFILPKKKIDRTTGRELPKIFYIYKYIKSISKLFGTNYTSSPTLVRMQFTNESNFKNWLNGLRPSERKSTSPIHLCFEYGLLYPDAAFLNYPDSRVAHTFAVEIKPKQGWHIHQLPDDVLEMFDLKRGTFDKCRYCSMQFLKV